MSLGFLSFAALVVLPMAAALAVQLLTVRFAGRAGSVLLGVATLMVTGWLVLVFVLGADTGALLEPRPR